MRPSAWLSSLIGVSNARPRRSDPRAPHPATPHWVLEVNANPSIGPHINPTAGRRRNAAAVLADLPYLRIIHGKGTGALRDRVRALLAADARVARAALAPANQGGTGVTVAELA